MLQTVNVLFDIVLPVDVLVFSEFDLYLFGMHPAGTCCCPDSFSCVAGVLELQQQFEQDKKKIAEWKASRRFKPY